jgi:hypothetical protein
MHGQQNILIVQIYHDARSTKHFYCTDISRCTVNKILKMCFIIKNNCRKTLIHHILKKISLSYAVLVYFNVFVRRMESHITRVLFALDVTLF